MNGKDKKDITFNDLPEQFSAFLIKHNAINNYLTQLNSTDGGFSCRGDQWLIDKSFRWHDSPQGFHYWYSLQMLWFKELQ